MIGPALVADVTDVAGDAETNDLGVLHVHKGYKGSFGTTGAPIQLGSALVQLNSSGPCFLEASLNSSAATDINNILVALARFDVLCEIGSKTGDAGEIDFIRLLRGDVLLKANLNYAAATEVRVEHITNMAGDVNLTLATNSEALPLLRMNGGFCHSQSAITALHSANARLHQDTAVIVTSHIGAGGYLRYDYPAVDGDDSIFHVYAGGTLDFTGTEYYKTVDEVHVYPGGKFIHDPRTTSFATGLYDYSKSVAA